MICDQMYCAHILSIEKKMLALESSDTSQKLRQTKPEG